MKLNTTSALLIALIASAAVQPIQAQDDTRIRMHGYLTQGFTKSTDMPTAGIPTHFSGEYRAAAVQLGYSLSHADDLVLQFQHKQMGLDPVSQSWSDITLDWAFYRRQFGSFQARLGKVPMPRGIYNEIRDVGTLLPLYRAPYRFYSEGFETLNGIVVNHEQRFGTTWSLESAAFAGEWKDESPQWNEDGTPWVREYRNEETIGGQLWLNTPVQGLRVGAFAARWNRVNLSEPDPDEIRHTWGGSLDASFDRVMLRSEYRKQIEHGDDDHKHYYYAQAGIGLTPKLWSYAQAEYRDVSTLEDGVRMVETDFQDRAIGLAYRHSPNVVFKLEGHLTKGDEFNAFLPNDRARTRYGIASISLSF